MIALGLAPLEAEGHGVTYLPPAPAAEEFLAAVAELIAGGDPVPVLHLQLRTAETRALVGLARRALGTTLLTAVPLAVPPLAATVTARLLPGFARRTGLAGGRLVAGAAELAVRLPRVSWVRTAGRLTSAGAAGRRRLSESGPGRAAGRGWPGVPVGRAADEGGPGPGLGRWWPGAGYAVGPAGIRSVAKGWRPEPLSGLSVLAGTEASVAWLRSLPGDRPDLLLPARPDTAAWYGTARTGELVVVPEDLDALSDRIAGAVADLRCRWCGLPTAGPHCPYCGCGRPDPEEDPR